LNLLNKNLKDRLARKEIINTEDIAIAKEMNNQILIVETGRITRSELKEFKKLLDLQSKYIDGLFIV
tara:strand:- start:210 stop:410 length:201 start_codon:yes stop_codon:yes gene_type:complete